MHFLSNVNELQYAINITCMYIINDVHRKSFMQCKSSKLYCFNTPMAMLYSGPFYNGNAFINYKYSRKAIRPESALYKVASRLRVIKNVLKRVIFQFRIYHTRYIAIY
jgi:hypothetical protein